MTAPITTIEDIFSVAKGSPMERIIHYLVYQDFSQLPKDKNPNEGGEVISSLTLAEKALFATRVELAEKGNVLIETHNKIASELTPENFGLGKEKLSKISAEIEVFSKLCKDLESMLWTGIHHRLKCEGISHTGNLSATTDFLIVSSPKEDDEDDFFGIMGPLGMFLGEILGGAGGAHDCANCPDYDECDLPIKKAR